MFSKGVLSPSSLSQFGGGYESSSSSRPAQAWVQISQFPKPSGASKLSQLGRWNTTRLADKLLGTQQRR